MMNPHEADNLNRSLIDRVTADHASDESWAAFRTFAEEHPQVWEAMAGSLRDELLLRLATEDAFEGADEIEFPREFVLNVDDGDDRCTLAFNDFSPAQSRSWKGWVAAAVLGIAWLSVAATGQLTGGDSANDLQTDDLNIIPISHSSEELFDEYVARGQQEGRVVEELPKIMLRSVPSKENTAVEVFYVRQTIERATIDSAIQIEVDEEGNLLFVPVELPMIDGEQPAAEPPSRHSKTKRDFTL